MNIIRLAVNRPVTTTMVCLAVVLFGLFSASRLAIDLTPDISFPSLTVSTTYSGVAPEEIEDLITIPIEQALSTVPGVTGMESVSQEGSSRVTLRFAWGTDLETAINDVRANLDRVRGRLPDDASTPRVFRFDPNQFPIMTIGIGGDMDVRDLRRLAEDEIAYHIERIEGVASVTVQGGGTREIQVALDPLRMQAHGLTIDQVVQALRAENMNAPAGRIALGEAQFSLRTVGRLESIDDLPRVLIAQRDGVGTYLGDVATIRPASQDEGVRVRVDGRPGIVMSIQKQPGSNTVRVADAVSKTLDDLRRLYPELTMRPVSDSSVFIRAAVNNVVQAGVIGGLLAAVILLVFLRDVRATFIIALSMPVSIIASFILIERAGMTLNVMSLGGLALGVGMLLDNSIVALENIFRHRSMGKPAKHAAIDGAEEMASALLASTLTTLAVFIPLMFLSGMSGIMFRQLSLMVAFSVTCSLVAAITVLPVLASKLLQQGGLEFSSLDAAEAGHNDGSFWARISRRLGQFFDRQEKAYREFLASVLPRPRLVVGVAVVVFGLSLLIVPYLGSELMPQGDEGQISIAIALPPGTHIDVTDAVAVAVEDLVREHVPEVQAIDTRVGAGSFGGRGSHSATVNVTLVPVSQRERSTDEVVAALRRELQTLSGINTRVTARGSFVGRLASGSFGGSGGDRISLSLVGYDLALLYETAEELQQRIAALPAIASASIARDEGQPEFVVRIDRERVADLGLTTTQVAQAVQAAVQGRVATNLTIDGQEYGVRVMVARDGMARDDFLSAADVEALPIPAGGGEYVPLGTVARLMQQDSPAAIQRLDRQRAVTITASPVGRDLGGAVAQVQAAVEEYGLPDGVSVRFGGEYEEQQQAFRELLIVLLLGVALVYVVMASQFESLLDPLLVMFSVPFALTGVIWMLALTDTPVTSQAYMGLIMLAGIVVNNAIVLVTYFGLLQEQGMDLREAVLEGSVRRLRPILMTTGTTVLALVPLALEFGEGSEIQSPLARSVIGGLTVSTLVTLVLIPTLYLWAHRALEARRVRGKEGEGWAAAAEPSGAAGTPGTVSAAPEASPAMTAREAGATTRLLSVLLAAALTFGAGSAVAKAAPRSGPEETLTLEAALVKALAGNERMRAATEKLELARSRLREEEAAYSPRLDVRADWEWGKSGAAASRDATSGLQVRGSATQVIPTGPLFGRPSLDVAKARLAVEAAEREWRHEAEGVALAVVEAYVAVLKAEHALEVSERALQRAEDAVEEVRLRLELGMAGELDLLEVEVRREAARLALDAARERVFMARQRLGITLGLEEGIAQRLEPPADPEGTVPVPKGPEGKGEMAGAVELPVDLERVYEASLAVFQAEHQLEIARLEADLRVSGRAPVFDVSARLTGRNGRVGISWESRERNTSVTVSTPLARSGTTPSRTPQGDRFSSETSWEIGAGIAWPLWDGGVEKEKSFQETTRLEGLEDAVARAKRSAALDVRQAWWAALEAERRVAVAAMERDVAEVRLARVRQRVEVGAETMADLLDAELALLQAEQRLEEARFDRLVAEASYRRAVGESVWPVQEEKL